MLVALGGDVNWNYFRYAADYLHFGGMILGIVAITMTRSVAGFSKKTQILFQLVYVTRYLDVLTESQTTYLVFFKLTFNAITAAMLASFNLYNSTYDSASDSCNLVAVIFPTAVISFLASSGSGLQQELWTFSEFLEPLALVPQYILFYRNKMTLPKTTLVYIFCVGGYRVLYMCNWIYKRYMWSDAYHDYTSWFCGAVECGLFLDFAKAVLQSRESSALGQCVLQIDDKAEKITNIVELKTFGRRLSGPENGYSEIGGPEGSRLFNKQPPAFTV
jgi:ER lumen protein retaining receptor